MVRVLIYDRDEEYGSRLADALARGDRELAVGRAAPGGRGRPEGASYDFVLTDEGSWEEAEELFPDAVILLLAESPAALGCGGGFCPRGEPGQAAPEGEREAAGGARPLPTAVKRFGRASGIRALIRREHSARGGTVWADGAGEGKGAVFICCLGLAGGCGTSSVAIGVGREIAAYKEKRTLYLSLEPLESDRLCLGGAEEQAGKDMGGFLYALAKRGMGNGRGLAEGYLHKDSYGLERFLPSGGRNDLEALPLEEFKALARNVLAPGFEAIVFDLGHGAGAKARWLVESCDALALVGRGGGKEEKTAALVREGWGADGARVVMVRNMAEADAGEDEGGGPGEAKPRLPRPRPGFGRALPRLGLGPPPGADRSREREGEGADGEDAHCVEILFDRESFSVEGGMTDFTLANHFGGGVRRITEALLGEGGLW